MAVRGQIWGDSTVGSVGSSSSVDSSLSGNMRDLAFFDIKTFALSIGLEVSEERKNVLNRLFWESTVVMVDFIVAAIHTVTAPIRSILVLSEVVFALI